MYLWDWNIHLSTFSRNRQDKVFYKFDMAYFVNTVRYEILVTVTFA